MVKKKSALVCFDLFRNSFVFIIFPADAIFGGFQAFQRFLRHFHSDYFLTDYGEIIFFCMKVPRKKLEKPQNRLFTLDSTCHTREMVEDKFRISINIYSRTDVHKLHQIHVKLKKNLIFSTSSKRTIFWCYWPFSIVLTHGTIL